MEKNELLEKVMQADFECIDLGLYLNTHPNDQTVLERHRVFCVEAKKLKEEYERLYGPMTSADTMNPDCYAWIDNPWPWDKPCADK